MRHIVALLGLLVLATTSSAVDVRLPHFRLGDMFDTAINVTTGVISKADNLLPTPEGLFDTGKQVVAGYPFEFVSSAINQLCSAALSSQSIKPKVTPDINKMQFRLITPCQNFSFPLTNPRELWKSRNFDPAKKTVILATGWTSNIDEVGLIYEMSRAYFCRGDTNFVAVDAASYVDNLYTWSALNTEEIGANIGKGLVLLSDIVPLENIHLIGHSLGAHIVGAAGREFFYQTGKQIPRITGLDPAKPCFNEGETLTGLQRGDADFIDVIHSNPGVMGKREPSGDVDFYPGGLDPLPVGCLDVICAHFRSWLYYIETVYPGNENNFLGKRCGSLKSLRLNKCPGKSEPMGYAVSRKLKGNYFLEVNSSGPYGKEAARGRNNEAMSCGECQSY